MLHCSRALHRIGRLFVTTAVYALCLNYARRFLLLKGSFVKPAGRDWSLISSLAMLSLASFTEKVVGKPARIAQVSFSATTTSDYTHFRLRRYFNGSWV